MATLFCFITTFNASAQDANVNSMAPVNMKEKTSGHNMNIIKTNLTGIFLKNYSLQYERILSKTFSIALSYRTMPSSTLPFKTLILKQLGDDPETKKTIDDLRLSNTAITPEVRIYMSKKGYGRGFYIAPFYRHANFKSDGVNVFYTTSTNVQNSIKLSGELTSNTAGLLLGVQRFIGKRIVLDTWIFGPHYGSGKGDFIGTSSRPLTQDEQNGLRNQLNSIDIPLTDKTVSVNANGATSKLDGPWGGIRSGISLGFKF
jgi:hypothetical protein